MTSRRKMDAFYCIASMTAGLLMLWLGGFGLVVGAMCWFMAGGFFQRAMKP